MRGERVKEPRRGRDGRGRKKGLIGSHTGTGRKTDTRVECVSSFVESRRNLLLHKSCSVTHRK